MKDLGRGSVRIAFVGVSVLLAAWGTPAPAAETPAERGFRWLLEKPYVPPYFDTIELDSAWRVWPEPLRSEAKIATPETRRQMAFARYGLTPRPDDPTKSLQFVVDDTGNWVPNCFTCHGGKVRGESIPGLPNSHYALETMISELRATKLLLARSLDRIDAGALFLPLGGSNGTTNAVIFGVYLGAYRDADLNLVRRLLPPAMLHHDMDAPPWWHFRKKRMLYVDGFAQKGHRALMQFALDPVNGPDHFRQWEGDFRDIFAYLESLEPPAYPFPVDRELAARGRTIFEQACAECHGTYGDQETYPQRIVPIDEIKTDRARFDALTAKHRDSYRRNWFSHYGEEDVIVDPEGYVAPPLDGIWASAPYLHNGSVPTLWHLLRPDTRPPVWKRTEDGYDQVRVGLEITSFDAVPESATAAAEKRTFFDTRKFGKSAAGHDFPAPLSEDEKQAVLEYLKTL